MTKSCANMYTTSVKPEDEKKFREPFVGKPSAIALSKMTTQSISPDKNLITPNTKETSESHGSAVFCVDWIERRKLKIGIRINESERKALESAARERRMTLSDYVRESMLNPKSKIAA